MKHSPIVALLALGLLACGRDPGGGGDWPGWRGPSQDGSAPLPALSADRPVELELAWKRPLGSGYSSISVVGDIAVTMFSDGHSDHLVALRAETGDELWRHEIGPTYRQENPEAADGPLGTPTIHRGVVYGVGPRGDLFAVSLADGTLRWSLRIDEQLGGRAEPFGFATSPVVVAGTLVVPTGAQDGRSTCGLDPASGDVRWCHGSDPVGYQSPLESAGSEPRVVVTTNRHVYGLDPVTGEELWKLEHIAPVMDGYAQVLPLAEDRLVLYYLSYAAGYRIPSVRDTSSVEELWRTQDLARNIAAPVARDGRIYGFQRETLVCLDAATGQRLWILDEGAGRGLVALGNLLAIWESDGRLMLASIEPDGIRQLAAIGTGLRDSYTSPSYANGRLFVRNLEEIAAVRVSSPR